MLSFILRRAWQAVPLLFFISLVSFFMVKLAPGDPVLAYALPGMDTAALDRIRQNLGLDQPIYVQYWRWLLNILQGEFGYSLTKHRAVTELVLERLPATFLLMGTAFVVSILIALPVALISAANPNSWIDRALSIFSYIGISIPLFWFAIMLSYFFSSYLNWLPSIGMRTIGVNSTWDVIKHLILPCTGLVFLHVSVYSRYLRSHALTQLNEEFVQVQYAFGAHKRTVLWKHVLKNAMLPLITLVGMSLPELIAGAFITEFIFSWPGMGSLGIEAVFSLDYPLIMAITLLSSIALILGNLLADVLYAFVDPRIKLK